MSNDRCAVTEDLNRHEASQKELDAKEDRISKRTFDLLSFDPEYLNTPQLSVVLEELTVDDRSHLDCLLTGGTSENLGRFIQDLMRKYNYPAARRQAEREVDADWNLCSCHGAGCQRCEGGSEE